MLVYLCTTITLPMQVAPMPVNEKERLAELYRYELLDTPCEKDFDDMVKLASQICKVPVSAISLIDSGRQWFKARVGLNDAETRRDMAFCSHAILEKELMQVPDLSHDHRFTDHPYVVNNGARFYAGMPLVTERGFTLGTLCVIDTIPRNLTAEQTFALKVLAGQIMHMIELRMRNRELQNLTRTQERIISIIAHDVRNPLASLKSILELKDLHMVTDEEADELMSISARQMDNTIDMVANIVEWGRLQMKREHLKQEFNLNQLVKKVFGAYELSNSLKNNQLVNEVAENITIEHDPQAIQFILRNLINNAIKFTENGAITVSVQRGAKLCIKICDTGIGIQQDRLQTMFDTQKNFSTPGTHNEKGSGLGLVLIKEFLDKIKGELHIVSAPGKGTCVSICL